MGSTPSCEAMFKKTIIRGCESRGDGDLPYMTRYTLIETKLFQVCLHIFHRSDFDVHHDHPWNFSTFILWRGYNEEIFKDGEFTTKRARPLSFLRRKAEHCHRVILINEKPAVTLVFMGKRYRVWGFFSSNGWTNWIKYFRDNNC